MRHTVRFSWSLVTLLSAIVMGLGWLTAAEAQTVSGQARVVQATVLDVLGSPQTTVLSDTGTLSSSTDDRGASQITANIPSLLTGEVLHATTFGWLDQVASEASLSNLALTVAGISIGADFVMARVLSVSGTGGVGKVNIDGLAVNGLPISVTGDPNQTISIPGGLVVINEQQNSATSTVVNALHVIVYGAADVVVASATAGVQ